MKNFLLLTSSLILEVIIAHLYDLLWRLVFLHFRLEVFEWSIQHILLIDMKVSAHSDGTLC
jgi:hypothetical protein